MENCRTNLEEIGDIIKSYKETKKIDKLFNKVKRIYKKDIQLAFYYYNKFNINHYSKNYHNLLVVIEFDNNFYSGSIDLRDDCVEIFGGVNLVNAKVFNNNEFYAYATREDLIKGKILYTLISEQDPRILKKLIRNAWWLRFYIKIKNGTRI